MSLFYGDISCIWSVTPMTPGKQPFLFLPGAITNAIKKARCVIWLARSGERASLLSADWHAYVHTAHAYARDLSLEYLLAAGTASKVSIDETKYCIP